MITGPDESRITLVGIAGVLAEIRAKHTCKHDPNIVDAFGDFVPCSYKVQSSRRHL